MMIIGDCASVGMRTSRDKLTVWIAANETSQSTLKWRSSQLSRCRCQYEFLLIFWCWIIEFTIVFVFGFVVVANYFAVICIFTVDHGHFVACICRIRCITYRFRSRWQTSTEFLHLTWWIGHFSFHCEEMVRKKYEKWNLEFSLQPIDLKAFPHTSDIAWSVLCRSPLLIDRLQIKIEEIISLLLG